MKKNSAKKYGDRGGTESSDYWLDRSDKRNRSHFGRRPSHHERRREQTIKDWLGPEDARGFMLSHQRPAEHISDVMGEVLTSLGMRRQALLEELMDQWEELVGGDVARNSAPCRLLQSRLDIEVENPSWLYVLRTTHAGPILARVKEFSKGRITEIRFVPAGRHRRSGA